ncbi:hypothetical protein GJ496_005623 [Pomphorhynchus laevis]|nr:hypothetical protein GJ496_005623 [Pomphorhynchus laevis]
MNIAVNVLIILFSFTYANEINSLKRSNRGVFRTFWRKLSDAESFYNDCPRQYPYGSCLKNHNNEEDHNKPRIHQKIYNYGPPTHTQQQSNTNWKGISKPYMSTNSRSSLYVQQQPNVNSINIPRPYFKANPKKTSMHVHRYNHFSNKKPFSEENHLARTPPNVYLPGFRPTNNKINIQADLSNNAEAFEADCIQQCQTESIDCVDSQHLKCRGNRIEGKQSTLNKNYKSMDRVSPNSNSNEIILSMDDTLNCNSDHFYSNGKNEIICNQNIKQLSAPGKGMPSIDKDIIQNYNNLPVYAKLSMNSVDKDRPIPKYTFAYTKISTNSVNKSRPISEGTSADIHAAINSVDKGRPISKGTSADNHAAINSVDKGRPISKSHHYSLMNIIENDKGGISEHHQLSSVCADYNIYCPLHVSQCNDLIVRQTCLITCGLCEHRSQLNDIKLSSQINKGDNLQILSPIDKNRQYSAIDKGIEIISPQEKGRYYAKLNQMVKGSNAMTSTKHENAYYNNDIMRQMDKGYTLPLAQHQFEMGQYNLDTNQNFDKESAQNQHEKGQYNLIMNQQVLKESGVASLQSQYEKGQYDLDTNQQYDKGSPMPSAQSQLEKGQYSLNKDQHMYKGSGMPPVQNQYEKGQYNLNNYQQVEKGYNIPPVQNQYDKGQYEVDITQQIEKGTGVPLLNIPYDAGQNIKGPEFEKGGIKEIVASSHEAGQQNPLISKNMADLQIQRTSCVDQNQYCRLHIHQCHDIIVQQTCPVSCNVCN